MECTLRFTRVSPLQDLFLRAWTTTGFADSVAASPHAKLAENGLAVARNVSVTAFGWREATRHLCPTCQLAIPGVSASVRTLRRTRASLSPLDALFARATSHAITRVSKKPYEALSELGLAVTANVRVKIRATSAARSSLELQLCEAYHACLCKTPELEPLVFRNWPR
jgi:hypothetical protein